MRSSFGLTDDDMRRSAGEGVGMASKINAAWHKAHRMPPRATLDQRVAWHLAHWKACACRTTLPASIVTELEKRGATLPARRA
jgi:hypothetical protein